MVAHVLVEIKALDKTFTYLIPKGMKADVGYRCIVPFGNKQLEGFITKIEDDFKCDYELKKIISLVDDHPVLNNELMEIGSYISKKTLCNLISSYQTMLPSALKAHEGFNVSKKSIKLLKKVKEYDPLNEKENLILSTNKLSEANKISSYITKKLIEKGILEVYEEEVYRINDDVNLDDNVKELTKEQKEVIDKVSFKFQPYLLHGVTGSGKTEVYMRLISKVKTALVLVPEISLTPQLVNNFKMRFGNNIAVLHSNLSNGEKYDEWRKIENGEASIVIGARSAVFAPLKNIGIIIIDEEHSNTYKQDNNPRYNAIDVALFRAKKHNCPIILGSATPSIESYTRAKSGIYELLEMKSRVNNNFPMVTLVDMKEEIKNKRKIFSSILTDKIKEKLNNHEQVILLLNRRGYTTIVTCKDCGFTHKCPNCDIPLTHHYKQNKMICHYCNYETNKLKKCPSCYSDEINEYGMGTEKLEQEVLKNFNARVIRMDVDTTRTKNAHQKIIDSFSNKEYDILIGTQMIAKGLDFPNVTLVGVINGDASLSIPDFRSAERTFQLLSQVSGRSGRSNLKGEVVIQGFNIDHYSLICASKNDYIGFYNKEMKLRKTLNYPPFYNLCLIRIQSKDNELCYEESNKIVSYLKENIDEIILGPSPSSMFKVNNNYFYQIIIKYKDTKKILPTLKFINERYKNTKVVVSIDFNPNRI